MQHTGRTVLPADPPMYTQEGPVVAGANANEEYWRNAEMMRREMEKMEIGKKTCRTLSLSDIQTRFVTGKAMSWAHNCWVHFIRQLMGWQRPTQRERRRMKGHKARCKELTMTPQSRRENKKHPLPAPTKTMGTTSQQDMSVPQSRAMARTHLALSSKAQAWRLFPSAHRKPMQFIR